MAGVTSVADFSAAWTLATSEGASLEYGRQAMALRGGKGDADTSSAVCQVLKDCAYYTVTATILTRSLGAEDRCYLLAGVDGVDGFFGTVPIALLVDGQDTSSAPEGQGITRTDVVAGRPGQPLVLKLSLDHSNWYNYCYLRTLSVTCMDTTQGTTPEPTTSFDPSLVRPVYDSTFDSQIEVNTWTYAGNYVGLDVIPGWYDGGLLLRNAGSVTYAVDVDMSRFWQLQVFVRMSAESIETTETCQFVVSFDGFATTHTVETLDVSEDTGQILVSNTAIFLAEDFAGSWNSLHLRMTSNGNQNNDKCYLHEVGVAGLRVNPTNRRGLRGNHQPE